ncbi:DUF3035 domain-containing protein, partial [Candidatus Pelagibacter sp.]|nr:DUF3035 domain-containing protein [Candidatus Pelagibacter sp.]
MKIFKKLILLSFICFFTSCGTLKDGFSNQKKNNNDEFLVEKKSPLIMPPDYNELPTPNTETSGAENEENPIKSLVTNEENILDKSNVKNSESKDIE